MLTLRPITAACVALTATVVAGPLGAQTSPAGGHVHYAEPSAQQASPTGALAPHLQIASIRHFSPS